LESSLILDVELEKKLLLLCEFSLDSKWTLLYRASRDGFTSEAFHAKCDNKSNTLTIIKSSNGNIFGGYTEAAWASNGSWTSYKENFVFSLLNKDNQAVKLKASAEKSGISRNTNYGPVFGCQGAGCDIFICSNSNSSPSSFSNLGSGYKHPVYLFGTDEAKCFFAGSFNFTVSNIEVYQRS
jgi:hypothetical protein